MESPGSEDRTWILSINIQDGKAFGPELQAVACAATFAGETKLTPYSVGRDSHVWNTTLQWRVTMDQFRRLTSLGQKDCKVVLSSKDGTKLGWFLVDVRAAKLQAQYKKIDGTWVTLTGAKKGEAPQVHMVALFYEDRPGVSFSPEQKQSPSKARTGARRKQAAVVDGDDKIGQLGSDSVTPLAAAPESGDGGGHRRADGAPGVDGAAGLGAGAGQARSSAAGAPPVRNPTAGLPDFGSPGSNPADDGPFRRFALTVDVRSFQSSKRLPLSSACVYVQAVLPAELIELVVSSGFKLPSRLAPLSSHPAVDIPRGAEGALPNGYGTVEFSAGVVQLARVLAREPRISVEAWHKERFRTDMLLGAGSVPLSPLLQGAWVDGYAPLFALVTNSVAGEVREERVQMGLLRVVLSLEDKGPAPVPGSQPPEQAPMLAPALAIADAAPGLVAAAPEALRPRPSPYDLDGGGVASGDGGAVTAPASESAPVAIPGGSQAPSGTSGGQLEHGNLAIREMHPPPPTEQGAVVTMAAAAPVADVSSQPQQHPALPMPQAYSRAAPPVVSLGSPPALTRGVGPNAGAAAGLPRVPEFEAAWELEVWKKAEEARWRSELREREAQRMMVLESEWRRRERAREAELASLKAEYLALEEKAQQALGAAEGRERRILAAEEALLRRRKELEREHAARMVEAEAAVRRLQVECEHQLDIERDRNAELVRRVAALEERLAASEMRCLTVENEFADFRAAARSTPEAELARQLAEAREAVKAAETRAAKAAKAKQGYKEQVRKLAEQVAALQRRRHNRGSDPDDPLSRSSLGPLGAAPAANVSAIRAAAEEQARYASSQQQELAAMRAQLQAIKAAALAQLSPTSSPRAPAGAAAGGAPAAAGSRTVAGSAVPQPELGTAGDSADEAADLRSIDQQRYGRTEWRGGGGRPAPHHAGTDVRRQAVLPEPNETPTANPAAAMHAHISSTETNASVAGGGTSSTSSSTARHPHSQQLQRRLDDGVTGHVAATGASAVRWAEPRPAASAPRAGGGGQPSPPQGHDPGSSGKATSAPASATAAVQSVSTSTSMTRTVSAAVAAATTTAALADAGRGPAPAPAAPQQRRGWAAPADRMRDERQPVGSRLPAAQAALADGDVHDGDYDGRWEDGDGWGQQNQQQQGGSNPAAVSVAIRDRHDDESGDSHHRRSLADHLASATSASQLRELHAADRPQEWARERQRGLEQGQQRGASPPRASAGPRQGAVRASWQLPPQQQQQSRQRPGGGDFYKEHDDGNAAGTEDGRAEAPSRQHQRDMTADASAARPFGGGSANYSGPAGAAAGAYITDTGGEGGGGPNVDLMELQRLTRRKVDLLQRGYDPDDPVVALLDERIKALIANTAGLTPDI